MRIKLIAYTPDCEAIVARAASLCYSKEDKSPPKEKRKYFIDKLLKMGHISPFEHISFTFSISGISRACSHQLVRHRIASYSQQSQRYVFFDRPEYIIPETIKDKDAFSKKVEEIVRFYHSLVNDGVPKEDARYILPQAFATKFIMTMNARELLHFFRLRCCNRAQWEIGQLAENMLSLVKDVAPNIFNNAGPPCITGPCLEGEFSCKKPRGKSQ
ncbi:TPA: FAD-dependent thymidylate synthase [bacterium]|nr:FAD-dependent thymidylate synthase [bacterium]